MLQLRLASLEYRSQGLLDPEEVVIDQHNYKVVLHGNARVTNKSYRLAQWKNLQCVRHFLLSCR